MAPAALAALALAAALPGRRAFDVDLLADGLQGTAEDLGDAQATAEDLGAVQGFGEAVEGLQGFGAGIEAALPDGFLEDNLGLGEALPVMESISTGVQPEKWEALNRVLRPYEKENGKVDLAASIIQIYNQFAQVPFVRNICKSRLYGGHAVMLLLMSNPKANVYVYDTTPGPYASNVTDVLNHEFPGRFSFSESSLANFTHEHPGVKCDLMIVGGTHGVAPNDDAEEEVVEFQKVANPAKHFFLMDDTPCSLPYCASREKVWQNAVASGQLFEYSKQNLGGIAGVSCGYLRPLNEAVQPREVASVLAPNSTFLQRRSRRLK